MKLLIALYFFMLGTIQLGLLIGMLRYFLEKRGVKPSTYWISSLGTSVLALFIFGFGVATNSAGTKNPEFNFTIANSLFYIAGVLQFLFCRSLNGPISPRLKYFFIGSVILFVPIFEYMRQHGTFEMRTSFIVAIISIFFTWQIIELNIKKKTDPSKQLLYIQFATGAELFLALGRLTILLASGLVIREVEQLPQALIFLTIFQIVMNTLSYIAIGAYWSEKITQANTKSEVENLEIKKLLREREGLIASLLKANKTAATGALSASIAHELNQPLGASQLNIQFLQKKLAEGHLTTEQNQEILNALLEDNQRATTIIQSLRSIFSDGKIGVERIDIVELIESVLKIAKPEIQAKNLQVALRLESKSFINANRGEIQQVLLNLINNAIQALGESTRSPRMLQIKSHDVSEGIQLLVSDNGGGVAIDAQVHLFELLSGSHKRSGMGLGLWLCQHIVSRHGGYLRYQDAPGGGAQFIVFLPSIQH
ncbi:HAMP domain-containing histidine kinase [Polynucleobacter sp. MG-Unter2-18]|uniref:sensor histidine kinase n=1 Tax=Polynucleobacter sp. MG-Unter2-18 TaxID=2081052 RepID=UPI001BFE56B5|nr:HAMP domain-containing sensor histidine kinase [Polynucleobacter sp. MG-Unter2-18]QWD95261.1 HAMP domain-containing histidine kinase [Polynucleobacter sp. MG-Unter2-18]